MYIVGNGINKKFHVKEKKKSSFEDAADGRLVNPKVNGLNIYFPLPLDGFLHRRREFEFVSTHK